MTLDSYNHLGRASVILKNHLEQSMTGISPNLEPAACSVLGALVSSERNTQLVKAGLIPYLENQWGIIAAYARCGNNPELAVAQAMHSRLEGADLADLPMEPRLADVLRKCYEVDSRLQVVFIDQTEEAFLKLGRDVLTRFAASLRDCLLDREGVTRFVFVIREDFLGRMAVFN